MAPSRPEPRNTPSPSGTSRRARGAAPLMVPPASTAAGAPGADSLMEFVRALARQAARDAFAAAGAPAPLNPKDQKDQRDGQAQP